MPIVTATDLTREDRFVVARRRRLTVTPSLGTVDVYDFGLATRDEPICHVRQPVGRFNQVCAPAALRLPALRP